MKNVKNEENMAASEEKQLAAKGNDAIGASHKRQIDGSNSSSSDEPRVNGLSSDGSHMFVFTNEKAGMKSVDKERANRIIYEMSKNSSYFKQAELQDQRVDVKVRCTAALQLVPPRLRAVASSHVIPVWRFKIVLRRTSSKRYVNRSHRIVGRGIVGAHASYLVGCFKVAPLFSLGWSARDIVCLSPAGRCLRYCRRDDFLVCDGNV